MLSRSVLILTLVAIAPPGFQNQDWSGSWVSHGGQDVVIVRNVHTTPRGWDQLAENLALARSYSITIEQQGGGVSVSFPTGANNILTIPSSVIGADPRTVVFNRGDWWTKDVTSSRWVDASLEIASLVTTGWWKSSDPAVTAAPRDTDFKKKVTISSEATNQLTLRVTVEDEKGVLEYIQRFNRSRG